MIRDIMWIKAHTEKEESQKRGFAEEDWQGSKKADEWAAMGTNSHREDERSQKQIEVDPGYTKVLTKETRHLGTTYNNTGKGQKR